MANANIQDDPRLAEKVLMFCHRVKGLPPAAPLELTAAELSAYVLLEEDFIDGLLRYCGMPMADEGTATRPPTWNRAGLARSAREGGKIWRLGQQAQAKEMRDRDTLRRRRQLAQKLGMTPPQQERGRGLERLSAGVDDRAKCCFCGRELNHRTRRRVIEAVGDLWAHSECVEREREAGRLPPAAVESPQALPGAAVAALPGEVGAAEEWKPPTETYEQELRGQAREILRNERPRTFAAERALAWAIANDPRLGAHKVKVAGRDFIVVRDVLSRRETPSPCYLVRERYFTLSEWRQLQDERARELAEDERRWEAERAQRAREAEEREKREKPARDFSGIGNFADVAKIPVDDFVPSGDGVTWMKRPAPVEDVDVEPSRPERQAVRDRDVILGVVCMAAIPALLIIGVAIAVAVVVLRYIGG